MGKALVPDGPSPPPAFHPRAAGGDGTIVPVTQAQPTASKGTAPLLGPAVPTAGRGDLRPEGAFRPCPAAGMGTRGMRDLLIALYSRPGLLPIAGMTLAGVVVIGWDLVRLAAGRWAATAAARRGRRPRAARTSRPTAAAP